MSRPSWPGLLIALALGCAGAKPAPPLPPPDAPVDPAEPRAEVRAQLDLPSTQDCEEALDLALYQNRGIDLIEWDARRHTCAGRRITVKYLPKRISRDDVVAALKSRAAQLVVLPER